MSTPPSPQLPEPSLSVLFQVIAAPALVHLGLVANPGTGKLERNLEQAKWTIDLLHVLEEKTRAAATSAEKAQMDAMLHQLRSAYAAATK